MARRGSKIPLTGGRELSEFTSWNNVSRALSGARDTFNRLGVQAAATRKIYETNKIETQTKNYARFLSGFEQMRGQVRGPQGAKVDAGIDALFKKIEAAGGSKIGNADLSKALGDFQKDLGRISSTATGIQGDILRDLFREVKDAKRNAREGGLDALGGNSKNFIKAAFGFKTDNAIEKANDKIAQEIDNVASGIADPALKQSLKDVRDEFNKAAKSAKNAAEKQQAMADVAAKLEGLGAGATGTDKTAMDSLVKNTVKNTDELKKNLAVQAKDKKVQIGLNHTLGNLSHSLGNSLKYLHPLKRTFDLGNAIFQQINSRVNSFARMQMMVASERGAYGRLMRGAGMNFSSMMSAIGTGRRAGMEDREVVDKMATMQEQLARARWGEGPIIENLGKWGLTPFDESGGMKDFRQVMIDISNKFNSLGDDMERLQFLSMQGFRPDQMEYVKNYARDARRWEELKAHPERMGVLERANILDESGFAAKVDAATKIELKRRQILNQNALEEGAWASLKRSINPENWFLNDWTARRQGVQSAKSEMAMEALQKELERVRGTLRDNNGKLTDLKSGLIGLDLTQLEVLSLQGGAAQADIANRGAQSSIYALRRLYAKELGLEDLTSVEERNKGYNAAIGLGGGALAGAGLGFMMAGPIGAAIGALVGGIGGTVGMYGASPFDIADDGSKEHIEALRKLKGNPEAISKYIQEHKLYGLTPEMVESEAFQDNTKAQGLVQSAYRAGLYSEAQSQTDKSIDLIRAQNYTDDPFYKANLRAAKARGEDELSRERHKEAIARVGTGDTSIGMDAETAYNYIKYGLDKNSKEYQDARNKKIGQLRSQWIREGREIDENELRTEAEKSLEGDFRKTITADVYKAASGITNLSEEQKAKVREGYEQEWDNTIKEGTQLGVEGASTIREMQSGDSNALQRAQRKLNEYKSIVGKKGYDQKFTAQAIKFYERILEQAKYGSKEAYAQAQLEKTTSQEELDKLAFGTGEKPFAYKTAEEQRAEVEKYLGRGEMSEAEKSRRISEAKGDREKAMERARKDFEGDETFKGLSEKEQKATLEERAKVYEEADRQKKVREIEQEEKDRKGETSLSYGARLARFVRRQGISLGAARDVLLSDDEVAEIERKEAAGEELDTATKEKWEQYKKGNKYKSRQAQKEAEKKAKEQKAEQKKEEEAIESSVQKLLSGEQLEETAEGENKDTALTDREVKIMRTAKARGYTLEKGFSAEKVAKFEEEENRRKKAFSEAGLGDEDAYEEFLDTEKTILQGGEVDAQRLEDYNQTKERLDKATERVKRTEYKPLHQEYQLSEEEQRDEEETLRKAEIAREKSKARARRGDLNKLSDLRSINESKKKGWSYDKIEENFGKERTEQYKAAVAAGEYEDYDTKPKPAITETSEPKGTIESHLPTEESKDATAIMKEKEEGIAQVSEKLAQAGESAEIAAASAKKAEGTTINADNRVTINMGGQQITQNIQGSYPMDQSGMKSGTLAGAEEICELAVQRVTDAVNSATKSKGSY